MKPLPEAFHLQLEALTRSFAQRLPERVQKIAESCNGLFGAPWSEHESYEAFRLAHSLAGSSGTYGFPEVSRLARQIETRLGAGHASRTALPESLRGEIGTLLASLEDAVRTVCLPFA